MASPHAVRDAEASELSMIQPGMILAVFYSDDTVWHERLVLWPSMDPDSSSTSTWWIVTPDFDVYPESLDDPSTGPQRVRIKSILQILEQIL